MGWTAPRSFVAGEIVTASMLNTHLRDQLRYLKGLDGVPTVESGLVIDNTDGDEYLKLPLLSTVECNTVIDVEGKVALDEQFHRIKFHDGTARRVVVSTVDVDNTPVNGATTDPISSNWAYDHLNVLTTAGDLTYATAAGVWDRLGIGTAGQSLRVNVGETAPEWQANPNTQQFFVEPNAGGSGTWTAIGGVYAYYQLSPAGEAADINFRVPNDFVALTSVKIALLPITTGTFDWTVTTAFGAHGQAYNTHTDSMTADGQAGTNLQLLELDISDAFTGISANDIVGIEFGLDTLTNMTALGVMGIDFKYT